MEIARIYKETMKVNQEFKGVVRIENKLYKKTASTLEELLTWFESLEKEHIEKVIGK
jgi:hypothetical protein